MIEYKEFDNKCWWCKKENITKEHKYKKTDLEREYFNKIPSKSNQKIVLSSTSDSSIISKYIQGSKSDSVKFKANLCKDCNGTKSQLFDRSYDKFIDFLVKYETKILTQSRISLSELYGDDWNQSTRNLIKYFVKNLGCTLTESNIKVPTSLINFLDEKLNYPNIELVFSQSIDRKKYLDLIIKEVYPASIIGRSKVELSYNKKTNKIIFLRYELYYRSFSFYINLENEMNEFKSNINGGTINIIKYEEENFKQLIEKMK